MWSLETIIRMNRETEVSSTKRGGKRSPLDFYATPAWCVTELYSQRERLGLPRPTLDPGAGEGGLIAPLAELWPRSPVMRGIELDSGRVARAAELGISLEHGDGMAQSWEGEHVLMNPPFCSALEWVTKGVEEARTLTALLRLGFLASQRRRPFWDANPPDKVVVMSRRPRFTGGGDSADYAWMHWGEGESSGLGPVIVWL